MYVENDDGMIYYVLQKQCCADDDSFDLPLIYNVNVHNLHFGRCEFCLVTGFKFGMDEEKFSKVSDEDAIRLYLLLSLEVIVMGRELVSVVDDVLLRMVDNLDAWNTFSWGPNKASPMKAEFQFFMWYAPRSPHVSIRGLYGEYLNKRSAARATKQKDSGEFHHGLRGRQKGREATLIGHQMAATLEDKLDIQINRFEKSLIDMKNSLITPTAPLKAVTEVCVTCGSNHNYNQCPLTRGENDYPFFHDNIQQFQTPAVGNFIQNR
nr:phospholipase-like, aminotransferase-like mobile domain protein [Tanacetum cinerariifolium]